MRKVLLAISALFILTGSSQGKEAEEGEMVCKVKSNYVVSIDEGIPNIYSGIENSFSKGDDLVFSFAVSEWGSVLLKLNYKDNVLVYNQHNITDNESEILNDGFKKSVFPLIHAFRSNWINIEGMVATPKLYLSRYYKGDWNGIYARTWFPEMTEQIATLDCRQSSDKVDDFINKVIEIRKKLLK